METDELQDPGTITELPLLFRVNRDSVRKEYATNEIDGRIPHAMLTFGNLPGGNRWRFLQPWCQRAVGAHDNALGRGIEKQPQAPFFILRLWSKLEQRPHFLPQAHYSVSGRFYRALVWVKGRGFRWTWVD